jgi:putative ABC transport system permease protein
MAILYLAWQYWRYHPRRSLLLIATISIIIALPMGFQRLVDEVSADLTLRAGQTPYILAAKGSRTDITISALYFQAFAGEKISLGAARELARLNAGRVLPLQLDYEAAGYRIVATELGYFQQRNLQVESGRLFALLGECVLGARVASELQIKIGDGLLTSASDAFAVAEGPPLKLRVTGIMQATGGADDDVIFIDLKSAWVIAGYAHGHEELKADSNNRNVLQISDSTIVASPALLNYVEITPQNMHSFHSHGNSDQFLLSAALFFPATRKDELLVRGAYQDHPGNLQLIRSTSVITDLLAVLLSARTAVLMGSLVMTAIAIVLLYLVFTLSLRLRREEFTNMRRLGAGEARICSLIAVEIGFVVAIALGIALLLVELASVWGSALLTWLIRI